MSMKQIRVASGIVRDRDKLLLVRQVSNGVDYWSLPGGVVEDHESLTCGLRRELFEETGLQAEGSLELAHVVELVMPTFASLAFVFTVPTYHGNLVLDDPANEVVECEFVQETKAQQLLSQLPWPFMREPIAQHLEGVGQMYWSYRHDGSGDPVKATRRPT